MALAAHVDTVLLEAQQVIEVGYPGVLLGVPAVIILSVMAFTGGAVNAPTMAEPTVTKDKAAQIMNTAPNSANARTPRRIGNSTPSARSSRTRSRRPRARSSRAR